MEEKTKFKGLETLSEGDFIHIIVSQGLLKRDKKSIYLPKYQLHFLQQKYPNTNFSDSLREAIDKAIIANGEDFPNIKIRAKEALTKEGKT